VPNWFHDYNNIGNGLCAVLEHSSETGNSCASRTLKIHLLKCYKMEDWVFTGPSNKKE
jgi:hypothetical protein